MKKGQNIILKIFVCIVVIYELIQINNHKNETEKLGVLKQNVSDLQTSLTQKENEVNNLTQKIEADKEVEDEKALLKKEITKLEETASDLNKYMATTERNLSSLSKDIIAGKTHEVITYLTKRDFKSLSNMIHPVKGVRLSHTSEIQVNVENIIQKEQLVSLSKDNTKYKWGITDGNGQLIKLSFIEYFDKYICDKDYSNDTEVIYNKYIPRPNQNNNIHEIFKSGIIVEYFYKGTLENDYTDWKSLYLTFENYENNWYLSGIIHS